MKSGRDYFWWGNEGKVFLRKDIWAEAEAMCNQQRESELEAWRMECRGQCLWERGKWEVRPGSETDVLSEASWCARTSQAWRFESVGSQISTYFSKGYSGCGTENRLQVPGAMAGCYCRWWVELRGIYLTPLAWGVGGSKHWPEPLSELSWTEHYFIHCMGHSREAAWPLYTAHQWKETFSTLWWALGEEGRFPKGAIWGLPNPGWRRVRRLPEAVAVAENLLVLRWGDRVAFVSRKDTLCWGLAGSIKVAWMQSRIFKIISIVSWQV